VKILGEAAVAKFERNHAASRMAFQSIFQNPPTAGWSRLPDVKRTFLAADYVVVDKNGYFRYWA
jgi:hypothetical protein